MTSEMWPQLHQVYFKTDMSFNDPAKLNAPKDDENDGSDSYYKDQSSYFYAYPSPTDSGYSTHSATTPCSSRFISRDASPTGTSRNSLSPVIEANESFKTIRSSTFCNPIKKETVEVPDLVPHVLQKVPTTDVFDHMLECELVAADDWLNRLSWQAACQYEQVVEQSMSLEEEYRYRYRCPAPEATLDEETRHNLLLADSLASMVERAWRGCSDIHNDCSTELFSESTDKLPCLPCIQVPTPKSTQPHLRPIVKRNSNSSIIKEPPHSYANKNLSMFNTPPEKKQPISLQEADSQNSSTNSSRPMQVHIRFPVPRKQDAIYNVRYKTQPCVHFQKQRWCPLGDNCHFAHGPTELQRPIQHPKFQTRLCKYLVKTGTCPYGSTCHFRHT